MPTAVPFAFRLSGLCRGSRGASSPLSGPRRPPEPGFAARVLVAALALPAVLAGCTKTEGDGDEDKATEGASTEGTGDTDEGATAEGTPGEGAAGGTKTKRLSPDDPALAAPADVAAPPEDAEKSESGLAWKVLEEGTGTAHPGPSDRVTVHYTGWTTDGNRFDSSLTRGAPAQFSVGQVIPGWTEALQLMVAGEKRRVWIPAKLAYEGKSGPQGMLVFDIELLEITKAPEAPDDVAEAPADAKKTENGVAYRVLEEGEGETHPEDSTLVSMHYNAWSTEGQLFQSTVMAGRPRTTMLRTLLPGWREAMKLMVEGDKWRLWIPEELAFQGRPRAPQGTIVVDVELLAIMDQPAGMPGMRPVPGGGAAGAGGSTKGGGATGGE